MESITIRPTNKKQIKVFTSLAKALNVEYQLVDENLAIKLKEKEFLENFEKGNSIEDSRHKLLKYTKSLWTK
jgi:hypothetical protein